MKRPQDPRKHGLKNPEEIITEVLVTNIGNTGLGDWKRIYSVNEINLWIKERLTEISSRLSWEGVSWKITKEATIDDNGNVSFTVEYRNVRYQDQLKDYNAIVAQYEQECKDFVTYEASLQVKAERATDKDLDAKIVRTQERLANLIARRNRQPLPYPGA